ADHDRLYHQVGLGEHADGREIMRQRRTIDAGLATMRGRRFDLVDRGGLFNRRRFRLRQSRNGAHGQCKAEDSDKKHRTATEVSKHGKRTNLKDEFESPNNALPAPAQPAPLPHAPGSDARSLRWEAGCHLLGPALVTTARLVYKDAGRADTPGGTAARSEEHTSE